MMSGWTERRMTGEPESWMEKQTLMRRRSSVVDAAEMMGILIWLKSVLQVNKVREGGRREGRQELEK